MLSFFRRYEKTFFLIVFLPAIIGMGITSVIVTVLSDKPNQSVGKVWGEPIPRTEWDSIVTPRRKLMGGRGEEGTDADYQIYALCKAAEKAGIQVPDARLAKDIIDQMGYSIAQLMAAERIHKEGINTDTDEGKNLFRQYVFEYIQQGSKNFTPENYEKYLDRYNLKVQEYEAFQKRETAREILFNVIRDAATIPPEEIWNKFFEQEQKREAEIVTLAADAYAPTSSTAPSDKEIEAYYKGHKDLYDEPRRVDLEYVAAPFEKTRAEVPAPTEAELEAYFGKHTQDYMITPAAVGTFQPPAIVDSFSNVHDKVKEAVIADAAGDRAQRLLEQVAKKLDEQRAGGKVDMAAASAAVAAANTNTLALVTGHTGLLTGDEIEVHPLLNGFAAERWAATEPASATRTKGPLRGEKSVFILRTVDVKDARTPAFADVQDTVRADYRNGGDREIKKYYDENQWKYRAEEKWKFDAVVAHYAEFAKSPKIEAPSADDLNAFFAAQRAKLWPGKDAAAVGSAAIEAAWKTDKAKDLATTTLKKVREAGDKAFLDHKRAEIWVNAQLVDNAGLLDHKEFETRDAKGLSSDPEFKPAADYIRTGEVQRPCPDPFDLPNGDGKFLVVPLERTEARTPDFAEVKEKVRQDVLALRGYERAKLAGERLVLELQDLKGDAVAAKLKEKGLVAQKTGFFGRTTNMLPLVGQEANKVVAETFNCDPEGGFQKAVNDDVLKKVYLVRCASRKDPEKTDLAIHKPAIRSALLQDLRQKYTHREVTRMTMEAKGISPEHLAWVRARRDGPDGQISSKVRQIYVPNDKATLDRWLEDAARTRVNEALDELKKTGTAGWDKVVFKYSEDESTRSRGGEMGIGSVARGDLVGEYGFEFESQVFDLPLNGQIVGPLKSKKGMHLIMVTRAAAGVGDPEDPKTRSVRMGFKQLLVKFDPVLRALPAEVKAKARAIAEEKINKAKARLDAGEPFALVASEVGAEDDARAKGESFTVPYVSPLMRMALEQPLEPSDLSTIEPQEVAAPVPSSTSSPSIVTNEWHTMFCARDPQDREPAFKQGARAPRIVFDLVTPTKQGGLDARNELQAWTKSRPDHDATMSETIREWKQIVKARSTAPTAAKEGAFGLVQIDPQLRPWPPEVLATVMATAAGKRTDPIAEPEGFHIFLVVSVEKAKDDGIRDADLGDLLLRGTEWSEK
jgi:hypothetical protein